MGQIINYKLYTLWVVDVKRKQKAFFLFFFVFALAFPEYPAMIGEAAADSGQLLTYTLRDAKGTLTVDAMGCWSGTRARAGTSSYRLISGLRLSGKRRFTGTTG
jgi:hypothetical protein